MRREPKPKPAESPSLAKLVDEIGDLDAELAPHRAKLTRLEALRKLLRSEYADKQADSYFTVAGTRWDIQLGPKENERKVNVAKLAKRVGLEVLARIATVALGKLEKECSGAIVCDVVTIEATGTREIQIRPKAA